MEERIRNLELGQAETRIYVKEIRENIYDIKQKLDTSQTPSKTWQPIMLELIKLIGLAIVILGAAAGVTKILGK
jgi:hypothetical protein